DYDAKDIESRLPWLKRPRQELDVLPWVKRLYELKAWDFSNHLPLIQGFARAWGNRYVVQSGYGFEIGGLLIYYRLPKPAESYRRTPRMYYYTYGNVAELLPSVVNEM